MDRCLTVDQFRSADKPKDWYVVQTRSRHERVAEENLLRQGYQSYLPLIKQIKIGRNRETIRLEPMFPGYIFLNQATSSIRLLLFDQRWVY